MENNQLGIYLRKLRKEHNYTQEYVASQLHLIRQSYSHYETGRTIPSLESLSILSSLYDVPIDNFLKLELGRSYPLGAPYITLPYMTPTTHTTLLDKIFPKKSPIEEELVKNFRKLDKQEQKDILNYIKVRAKHKQP